MSRWNYFFFQVCLCTRVLVYAVHTDRISPSLSQIVDFVFVINTAIQMMGGKKGT